MKIYAIRNSYNNNSYYMNTFYMRHDDATLYRDYYMKYELEEGQTFEVEEIDLPFIPKRIVHIMILVKDNGVKRFETVGVYSCISDAENSDVWKAVRQAVKENKESYKFLDLADQWSNRGYEFISKEGEPLSTITLNCKDVELLHAKMNRVRIVKNNNRFDWGFV